MLVFVFDLVSLLARRQAGKFSGECRIRDWI